MKVALVERVGALDNLRIVDRPEPRPGPGEVLVRMRAASLNYRDLVTIEGRYGSQQRHENLIPLSDGAGEIAAVGPGVSSWAVGDRVAGCFFPDWDAGPIDESLIRRTLGGSADGVASEYRVFGERSILRIPDTLTFTEAASLPCAGVTAWSAVITHGAAGPAQTVLTQGTGGVSLFALQFATLAGAEVIATSSAEKKLGRLHALGARHVINYREDENWGETARKLAGAGVDVVADIGGGATLSQSVRALRRGGLIAAVGVVAGARLDLPVMALISKSARLHGIFVGNRQQFAQMLTAIAHHQMHPVIDTVFPLADLHAALVHLRDGRHVGKICIEI